MYTEKRNGRIQWDLAKFEDQMAMVETAPDSPWKEMDIAEILSRIATRDAKNSALTA